jgi:hypothetical protein
MVAARRDLALEGEALKARAPYDRASVRADDAARALAVAAGILKDDPALHALAGHLAAQARDVSEVLLRFADQAASAALAEGLPSSRRCR